MTLFGMISTSRSRRYTAHAIRTFFQKTEVRPQDSFLLVVNEGEFFLEADLENLPVVIHRNQSPQTFAENGNFFMRQALDRGEDLILLNNDVVFTTGWLDALGSYDQSIMIPISNNERQYNLERPDRPAYGLKMKMNLEDYLGHEEDFSMICDLHQHQIPSDLQTLNVLCAPFFVVKIPVKVMEGLGGFDTRYGTGGGEDYDYCMRAWLMGFSVCVAPHSFLLHFGGKSIETNEPRPEFVKIFADRWGQHLERLVFDDVPDPALQINLESNEFQRTGFKGLIMSMLAVSPGEMRFPLDR